jgi:site-specific DNA-cytosine methylase
VDNPEVITAVEWFFGYGGNHLGLKRVLPSLKLIAACEIEGYAVANMVAKMEAGQLDAAPIWSDCKTFPCEQFVGLVDIFIASYPCQPFSLAGKRRGGGDPRHLWPFVRRAVETFRPRYCFFENVDGHVSQGLREVLTELAMLGYRVENSRGEPAWGVFSAAEVGAPQQRKRVFILAERKDGQNGMGDYLREQVERFDAIGFRHQSAGASLAPADLENSKGRRAGTISNPAKEQGTHPNSDRSSEGVGQANASIKRFRKGRAKQPGRNGIIAPIKSSASELAHSKPNGFSGKRIARSQASGEPAKSKAGNSQAVSTESRREDGMEHSAGPQSNSAGQGNDRPGRSFIRSSARRVGDGQAVAKCEGREGCQREGSHVEGSTTHGPASERCYPWFWPGFVARPGQAQSPWEPKRTLITTFGGLGGGANGCAANVDRLRLLGNGVYPAVAAKAFVTLFNRFQPNNTHQATTTEI